MNKLHLLLLVIVAGLIFAVGLNYASNQANGTDYYVSSNGSDDNPGTRAQPLKTITKVNSLKLEPGDRLLFEGGKTFKGTLKLNLKGSRNDSIIVGSFGKGRATIDGGDKEAAVLKGRYFRFSDINAIGAGRKAGNTTNGIQLEEVSHARVVKIRTEGFQKSGLNLYNCENVDVKKVKAINNGFSGIYVNGSEQRKSKNIHIYNCRAENNPGDPTNLTNHSGNGILVGYSDNVVIDRCVATNNGWDMPRKGNGPVGIWAYASNNVTIQYCISYRNKTSDGAKDGGGFDFDGGITNSIIQYCLSYENAGAGFGLFQYPSAPVWSNNIIRYNLSINDAKTTEGAGGIFVWNGSDDPSRLTKAWIYNNVFYSIHSPAVRFEPKSQNEDLLFFNNIFMGSGSLISGPVSGERFAGNVWYSDVEPASFRGYESLKAWAGATDQEMLDGQLVGQQVNPLFRGPFEIKLTDPFQLAALKGFRLKVDSPLINSGLNFKQFNAPEPANDFYGTTVPMGNKPEPGIYEYPENQ